MFQENFDKLIADHLNGFSEEYTEGMKNEFMENQVVIFDSLIPEALKAGVHAEAKYLLSEHGSRRDITNVEVTGNTPRHYNIVGRDSIAENANLIPAFFNSKVIKGFLAKINNNETLHAVPYQPEEYIINSQQATGDTHGWHWDDYAFALIWVVKAPPKGDGALVEYVPNTEWDKSDPKNCVQKVLDTHKVNTLYVPEGACYLMKANTTLHRITSLIGNSQRIVIVFTYASSEDFNKEITHETMEQIYS
ncbi:HalD/BesD family halogenase [Bacillus pretiosus]|uniref:HalD/BesD family halogenase n=1 Tax=Bacillus pretiosus TaxID=2983392 RepID=UPI003D65BDC5